MSLRIQRSGLIAGSRSTAFNPLIDPDLLLALDTLSSPRDESGGFASKLYDLGPYGYDASGTAGKQPAVLTDAAGVTYLSFDGLDDFYLTPSMAAFAGRSGFTGFLVARDATPSARYILEYGASGGAAAGASGSFCVLSNNTNANSLSCFVRTNVVAGSNVWRSNANTEDLVTPKVLSFGCEFTRAAGAEIDAIRSMGAALAGTQTGTNEGTGTMSAQVLAINAQTTGANFSNLKFYALYIVGRSMDDAEKLVWEQYLSQRFKLPLPAEMASRTVPRIIWGAPVQSNSMGQLDTFAAIEAWDGPHTNPRIWAYKDYYASGSWFTTPWGGLTENPGFGWEGPDLVTCLELVRTYNFAPELIMCAQGATTLAVDWNPSTGTTYSRLVDTTYPTAVATHPAAPASVVPWIVSISGESDSASAPLAAAFGANLTAFYPALEADLPDLALSKKIIVRLHINSRTGAANATTVGQVRAAQEAYVAANPTTSWLINIDDLTLQGDNVHWTEASAIEIGKRIAAVIAANS